MKQFGQLYQEAFAVDPEAYRREFREACRDRHLEQAPALPSALFVDLDLRRRVAAACEDLTGRLAELVQSGWHTDLPGLYGLPARVAELARLDPGPLPEHSAWRFDLTYEPESDRLAILECNAADPSGLGWVDQLSLALLQLTPVRALSAQVEVVPQLVVEGLESLLGEGPTFCVCPDWSFVHFDHHSLANLLERRGRQASAWDPAGLDWERLVSPANLYRDALDELIDHYPAALEGLLEARRRGVRLINPLGAMAVEPKTWLARISLEQNPEYLPWTRALAHLDRDPLSEREQLVLKPSFGYGGNQVILGSQVSPEEWAGHLQQAGAEPWAWVLQEYCSLPLLPVVDSPDLRVTLSAWVIGGRFAGMLARGSQDRVTNVNRGGALLPVFGCRFNAGRPPARW